MKFKAANMEMEFWVLDPKLRLILCDMDYWAARHGKEIVVTSLMRSLAEQAALYDAKEAPSPYSVHCDGRGADIRLLDGEHVNLLLQMYIEEKYKPYDEHRLHKPVVLIHGGTGEHIHVQVMPTTKEE